VPFAWVGWINCGGSSKLPVVLAALVGIGGSGSHCCGSGRGDKGGSGEWR
jgi:hypothetical protein